MAQNIRILAYSIVVADAAGNYAFQGTAQSRDIPSRFEAYPVNTPLQFPGLPNIIYSKIIYYPGENPSFAKEAYVMDSIEELRVKAG